jgi:hypothetical protein
MEIRSIEHVGHVEINNSMSVVGSLQSLITRVFSSSEYAAQVRWVRN